LEELFYEIKTVLEKGIASLEALYQALNHMALVFRDIVFMFLIKMDDAPPCVV
jgi:hypothetical protein